MTRPRLSDWDLPETSTRPLVSRAAVATIVRYGAALAAIAGGMLGIFASVGNLSGHLPLMLARWEASGLPHLLAMLGWIGLHGLAIVAGLALLRLVGIGRAITVIVLTVLTLTLIAGLSAVNSIDAAVPALIFAAYLLSRLSGVLNPRTVIEPPAELPIPVRVEPGMVASAVKTPTVADMRVPQPPVPRRQPPPRPSDKRPVTVRRSTAALIVALVAFDSVVITLIASSLIWPSDQPRTIALGLSEPLASEIAEPVQPDPIPDPVPDALPPIAAPVTAPAGYSDPFAYCEAVGTIDAIDARYEGPKPPPALSQRLGEGANSADVEIVWRCADGKVQACAQRYWPVCNHTPEMEDMITFCRAIGRTAILAAPGGPWRCEDDRPVLPEDASWPVDDRGFLPQAWTEVDVAASP